MFEQGYPFLLLNKRLERDEYPLIRRIIYRFENRKGKKYLVNLHEYEFKVFAIKFHLWEHKGQPLRYNLIVNQFDFSRTLKTILDIAMTTLQNEPLASFAFVGVHKLKDESKDTDGNQRFRVYKRITENFFGSNTFLHGYATKSNSYLLINKKNPDPLDLHNRVVQMFAKHFQDITAI